MVKNPNPSFLNRHKRYRADYGTKKRAGKRKAQSHKKTGKIAALNLIKSLGEIKSTAEKLRLKQRPAQIRCQAVD